MSEVCRDGAIILVTGILASFSGGLFSTIFGEKDYGKIQEENIKDTGRGSSLMQNMLLI